MNFSLTNFNVSVSCIKTFLECPEKWYHIYVLKHKKAANYSERIGDRVHYFIEKGGITGVPLEPQEEAEAIKIFNSIDEKAKLFGLEATKEEWFKSLLRYKNYCSNFMAKIDAYKYYPESKTIKVIDWKTGKLFEDKLINLQLEIYSYFLFSQITDAEYFEGQYYYIKNKANGLKPYTYPYNKITQEPEVLKITREYALTDIKEKIDLIYSMMINYQTDRETQKQYKNKPNGLCTEKFCDAYEWCEKCR